MHYVTWCSARRMRSISAPPDATPTFGTLAGVIGFPRTPRPSSHVLIGGDWQPRSRCIGGDLLQLRPHCVWHLVWSQVRCFVRWVVPNTKQTRPERLNMNGWEYAGFGRKLQVTWKSWLNSEKIIFVVFHCIIDCQDLFLSCEKSNYFWLFKEACRVE